jgi:amino acid adenylation domain-containing protein/non-ribosomal peptide synthase protein (TIGR01720 family)
MSAELSLKMEQEASPPEDVFVFPVSFAQKRLWFLDQFEPNSPFYNIPAAVRLRGALLVNAMERTLNEIVRRHEVLRTTFATVKDEPVQVISPSLTLPLPVVDLSAMPKEEREAEAVRLARKEARTPFNLAKGPLLRMALIKLEDEEHIILLTMHHIISDGWSMGVLISEIATIYDAFTRNRPSPLPPLKIQYADFSNWQREYFEGGVLEKQLQYWKDTLGDSSGLLELPTDRPRPSIWTNNGSTVNGRVPLEIAKALRSLGREQRATLFMTLLAAFQTLLFRYTGQEDINVGSPIANRNRAAIEPLIGFFVNTMVLRNQLSGEMSFRELVSKEREVCMGAFANQDLPFEMLVEALQPGRDMSYTPLFQVMFILQNAPADAKELPGFSLEMLDVHSGTATFDITLSISEDALGLDLTFEYNTDLYDESTMQRMLSHFVRLLEEVSTFPDQSISTLDILSVEEKHMMLVEWNETAVPYELDQPIHRLFEKQVLLTPDSVALVIPANNGHIRQTLTYRELDHRANQMAHYLQQKGVVPGTIMGLCVDRNLEMMIGLLGILKAGGAYLPLDPQYPKDRLSFMMEDSGIKLLVTQSWLKDQLPETDVEMICIDVLGELLATISSEPVKTESSGDDPVYMIYTSGSTGKSKGVIIQHCNLVNACYAWQDAYELEEGQAHLQMANFSFDVFAGDWTRALCSGGRLVLCPRDWLLMPRLLHTLLVEEEIEFAEFVPAVLRQLIDHLRENHLKLDSLKVIVCGSDVWYVGEYKEFTHFCGENTRLINSFGLTEATIDTSFFESDALGLNSDQVVPIGRPYANMEMYILDGHLQPVPIGVPGELVVGGAGVAKGYHHRPELTAERFILNPFVTDENVLLYRSGDLAKFRADGNVEFLGRLDHQIKIRGFRIEIGEIEAVLRQHSAVRDAVVMAVAMGSGEQHENTINRLVTYLVADINVDRIPLNSRCVLVMDDVQPPAEIELSTVDVSIHGVCVRGLPLDYGIGSSIKLHMPMPDLPEEIEVQGTVAWRYDGKSGITYQLSPADEASFYQSVKYIQDHGGIFIEEETSCQPRVSLHHKCRVEFEDGSVEEMLLENLSGSGARLVMEDGVFKQDGRVTVLLDLPELNHQFILEGDIFWHLDERVYVQFAISQAEHEYLELSMEKLFERSGTTLAQLRSYLKSKLPDYMVPSAYVMLSALPLTPNGKVDRKSLPVPSWSSRELETEFIPARTPLEEILVQIWSQVLGVKTIGVQDNFFDLGGHSLLATQVVSRMREALQVEVPLRLIFEYPEISGLGEQVEVLRRQEEGLQAEPIVAVERTEDMPLSFAEQRLWFLDQLQPNSPFYNIPEFIRINGILQVDILEKCLNEIIRRHEILRTTFPTVNGKAKRVIVSKAQLNLEVVDLTTLERKEQELEVRRRAEAEARKPFDLAAGPLLRVHLLRLNAEEHIILMTIHHIISDDWSTSVIVQEVAALYNAFEKGMASPLPELEIQYADFAHWQRNWLTGEVLEKQMNYWSEALSNLPPVITLPTDKPRPAVMSFEGDYEQFKLSRQLSDALRELSKREGVTIFMTLLAAFQALLARYAGQEDISVGTPIANRNRRDIEGLIGFFINTLVLRGDLSGEPSFSELLKRTREMTLGAYAHQDLPFEMIVDELQPDRDMSHTPLFQVMFVIQNAPMNAEALPGMTLNPIDIHSGTVKFDLTMTVLEEGDFLEGALEYSTDLYHADTIRRMLVHFENLLEALVERPDIPISEIQILTAEEIHQQVVAWNETYFEYPRHLCAHQLFEAQAALTPHEVAVAQGNEQLSFAELEEQANQLAHRLQRLGVGPDMLVGICLNRTPDLMVSMLAVWKAGGAYVPIDPTVPMERLAYIVQDAAMPVLITQSNLLALLESSQDGGLDTDVICVDTDLADLSTEAATPPETAVTPRHLAYVIYTSGSTGKPKGAMILHQGLVNYFSWTKQVYPLDEGTGSPVHSSISFDLTITSLFTPLISGKTVVLIDEEKGVEALGEHLQEPVDFSVVKITPAHLQLLGQQLTAPNANDRTHAFIIGGENLLVDHVDFWQRNAPEVDLVNEYGPTETVVGCCVYWTPLDKHRSGSIPIGRPIINTQLYILDPQQQLLPIGVPGELYIGGDGVARGYLNRPDLTEEKFIPDPFRDDPEARLYRTGDLVRYLPDGNIECLGRIDFQVKIRGYRVELGEIETLLGLYEGVKEAAVWVHESMGVKRLTGYIVPEDPQNVPEIEAIKTALREELPEYMIPPRFMVLDALPLAASGKLNRKALPEPEMEDLALSDDYVAPGTTKERILAEIWEKVLGLQNVGVNDNFFALGGDSILSIQIIARANQAGLRLSPRHLFEFPTIKGLAAAAGSGKPILAEQGVVSGEVALTPIQRWFFEQEFLFPNHWNQSIFLDVTQPLDKMVLAESLEALLVHHDALRLRVEHEKGEWRLINAEPNGHEPLVQIDLSELRKDEQDEAVATIAQKIQSCVNLFSGCLLQAAYFDLGGRQPDKLLIVIHHLAVDGISWRILLEDFQVTYQQLLQGLEPILPPKTTAFRDWANSLAEYVHSQETQEELAFWEEMLEGVDGHVPNDFSAGSNQEKDAVSLSVSLTPEETEDLLREVPRAYHTEINDVLLTALGMALQEWTGSEQVLVELEGHGREDIDERLDVSRTVGWFTAQYPLCLTLTPGEYGKNLVAVKQRLRDVPRHGLGYGLLRYLSEDIETREAFHQYAKADVLFNYLGQMNMTEEQADLGFGMSNTSGGLERSQIAPRSHLLDISAMVSGGQFFAEWNFSSEVHKHSTVEKVAKGFIAALQALIEHCKETEDGEYMASDFEEFGWDQDDLDQIIGEIDLLS